MILTVIVTAFLVARWWAVAVAAVVWPIVLIVGGDPDIGTAGLAAGTALAAVNGVIGVSAGRAFRQGWQDRKPSKHRGGRRI